jgi:hypothetical protein
MPLLCSLRLPSSDQIEPPTAAATAHTGRASGRYRILAKLPASPAVELTKMKAAEVPDVGRVPAQPVNSSKGLRKIPAPVPVNPESRPIAPPQVTAGSVGMLMPLSGASGVPLIVERNSRKAA